MAILHRVLEQKEELKENELVNESGYRQSREQMSDAKSSKEEPIEAVEHIESIEPIDPIDPNGVIVSPIVPNEDEI